ncbi:DNA/RNA non-specific endonuclease [Formicincola oecophyllae]|nr:DNA/RNA non-specific endonuclease [Formicincola oecophyllae]
MLIGLVLFVLWMTFRATPHHRHAHHHSVISSQGMTMQGPVGNPKECAQLFEGGKAPTAGEVLCNRDYAVGYDSSRKEPLWSAERLNRAQVKAAEALHGRASFHEDNRLPSAQRVGADDYRRSGWSAGHLTPSSDMPDPESRWESFAYSNIVPQDGTMNSGPWLQLEEQTRHLAQKDGVVYVITGPAWHKRVGVIGQDQLEVPSSFWKVVYAPSTGQAMGAVCHNEHTFQCRRVSVQAIEQVVGFRLFPALPSQP